MDIIADLAYPLHAIEIAEMLAVKPEDRDQLKKWSDDLATFLGNVRIIAETVAIAQQSALELTDYFRAIILQLRKNPGNGLLSALVVAEEQGDMFSEDELFSMCVGLLFAGHETTTNLIGNGLLALLQNPDQMQKLKDNTSLIETAVEEFLRYDSPVQATARIAKEELEIGGKRIAKGERVSPILGAANRDPEQFPNPDHLDIARADNRQVGFGFGAHFCLGAALARIEGQIAINTILRRMPELRLETADLEWHQNPVFRGLQSLPVTF